MIDVNKLKGKFKEKRKTLKDIADILGVSERTVSLRLKKGIFTNLEIEKLTNELKIEDPNSIFFAQLLSQ
ncbi:helix-turn-helix transcriptional regulator [Streptobacillus moniliformis]|uniref:helix-turn-helix transcriptional regulator n=2 Tax=Streptobacillus moniliformis TaxID=34105 RepID=UPI0007E4B92F|nr:hypothetical protein [Streptobacillus moniliformis]